MPGLINSLGIGSGVLTADLIDQLKDNERSATITPIENKLTLVQQKQAAIELLSSLTSTFKSSTSALSLDTLYQERTVTGNNDGVQVSVDKGTALQSFSITDVNLAKTNVQQSGNFLSPASYIATGSGTMTISIAGQNFAIDYDATTTLSDLKDKIAESTANDKLTASILQVGDDSYSLVLASSNTGASQSITITDDTGNLKNSLLSTAYKSGTFSTSSDTIATVGTSGNVQIDVNGITADLAYDDTTSLAQLRDMINADTTLKNVVSATIVEEGVSNFKLVLNPIGAQAGQSVTISDSAAGLNANILTAGSTTITGELTEVQAASDASFKYNGIVITRDSNTVDDIILGMSISLLQDGASSNINISQDREPIEAELSLFVDSYNSLQSQLSSMTTADIDAGTVGIFSGDSSVRSVGREIIKIINSIDDEGNSLTQYGIGLKEDGTMTFNPSTFNEKMDEDPDKVSAFFNGSTVVNDDSTTTYTAGLFENLNNKINTYTKFDGLLYLLGTGIQNEQDALIDEQTKSLERLNARYDTMTRRFMEYDAIINRINGQSSALTQQIEMAIAAAKG